MKRLVVIGGGIAGLAAAFYAAKITGMEVTLLESSARWGGKIVTERFAAGTESFIIEGGPDSFLATKPWALALCKELGLADRLQGTNPRVKKTYILRSQQLLPLPEGLALMIPTGLRSILRTGLLSWRGKARMGLDLILPPRAGDHDESLGAFVSRRLGREAYEALIDPLLSGIYAGDGNLLSLAATFPALRELEQRHGSLIRGAGFLRRHAGATAIAGSRSAFLTPLTGLAELVEVLVARLDASGVDMRLQASASRISKTGTRYRVELADRSHMDADAIVLAAPAFVSAKLLEGLDPGLAADLRRIQYVSTATVSLAFRRADVPRELDGYGYVIPRREERPVLACTWTSTKFQRRAPDGFALVRLFAGRAGQELPGTEAAILDLARQELRNTLGITADPVLQRVFVWENAMPQYNLGHLQKLKRIDAALSHHPGLALAGSGYRGVGIPDCIRSGEVAVESLQVQFALPGKAQAARTLWPDAALQAAARSEHR